jgi:hypothetical protein
MNDILFLPVKPKWADLIMSGKKTLELRKRLPSKGHGARCLIYSSSIELANLTPILVAAHYDDEFDFLVPCLPRQEVTA